jgi:hypothetical protein
MRNVKTCVRRVRMITCDARLRVLYELREKQYSNRRVRLQLLLFTRGPDTSPPPRRNGEFHLSPNVSRDARKHCCRAIITVIVNDTARIDCVLSLNHYAL